MRSVIAARLQKVFILPSKHTMITTACCLAICIQAILAFDQEPLCLSRYDYDYKVLRNIVSLEQKFEDIQKIVVSQANVISKQEQHIKQLETSQKGISTVQYSA